MIERLYRRFAVVLAAFLVAASSSAQDTQVPPAEPPDCNWIVGNWKCMEGSTQRERNLVVQSFAADEWRMAMFDESAPDENSDEWSTHKIGNNLSIGNGIKETTKCLEGNKLSIVRKLSFYATATNLFVPVHASGTNRNGQVAGINSMSFTGAVAAVGEAGFTESYSCKK